MLGSLASFPARAFRSALGRRRGQPTSVVKQLREFFDAVAGRERARWANLDTFHQQALQYQRNPWVNLSVSLLAEQAALGEFDVFLRQGEELTPQINHPIERLFDYPNRVQDRSEFFEAVIGFYRLTGNSYIFLSGPAGGVPDEMYPLRPDRVRVIPSKDGRRLIDGYIYDIDGVEIPFAPEEIIHFKRWHPLSDYYGLGSGEPIAYSILSDNAMARWNWSIFENDAGVPIGIVQVGENVPDGEYDKLKDEWDDMQSGRLAKVAFLRGTDLDFKSLQQTHRDLDYQNGRTFNKELILNSYKIPLGIFDPSATEASAKVAKEILIDLAIWPLVTSVARKFTQALAPFWSDSLVVKAREMRRKDTAEDRADVGAFGGVLTVNEIRKDYLKKKPLPGGDVTLAEYQEKFKTPALGRGAVPNSADPKALPSGDTQPDTADDGMAAETDPEENPAIKTVPLTRAAQDEVRRFAVYARKRLEPARRVEVEAFSFRAAPVSYQIACKALFDVALDRADLGLLNPEAGSTNNTRSQGIVDAAASAFAALRGSVLAGVRHVSGGPRDVQGYFDGTFWRRATDAFASEVRPAVQDAVSHSAREAAQHLELSHGLRLDPGEFDGPAAAYADTWAKQVPLGMMTTTRDGVTALIKRWSNMHGVATADLLDAVNASVLFSSARAALFGDNEHTRAAANGAVIAAAAAARSLKVPLSTSPDRASSLLPVHAGCECSAVPEVVFDENHNPVSVGLRFVAGGKSPCETCSAYNGKMFSEILGDGS